MTDNTEQVHIAKPSSNRSSYHTRRCSHYPDNPKQITKAQAEARGLSECTYCSGDFEPANKGGSAGGEPDIHEWDAPVLED
jgi:hypothetical protein